MRSCISQRKVLLSFFLNKIKSFFELKPAKVWALEKEKEKGSKEM